MDGHTSIISLIKNKDKILYLCKGGKLKVYISPQLGRKYQFWKRGGGENMILVGDIYTYQYQAQTAKVQAWRLID